LNAPKRILLGKFETGAEAMSRMKSALVFAGLVWLTFPTIALAQSKASKPTARLDSSKLKDIKECRNLARQLEHTALEAKDLSNADYCVEGLGQYLSLHALAIFYERRTDQLSRYIEAMLTEDAEVIGKRDAENDKLVNKYNTLVHDYNALLDKQDKLRAEYERVLKEKGQIIDIALAYAEQENKAWAELSRTESKADRDAVVLGQGWRQNLPAIMKSMALSMKAPQFTPLPCNEAEAFERGVAAGSLNPVSH
jgi:hypothetical protein